jgi:hypothetical protein
MALSDNPGYTHIVPFAFSANVDDDDLYLVSHLKVIPLSSNLAAKTKKSNNVLALIFVRIKFLRRCHRNSHGSQPVQNANAVTVRRQHLG